LVKLNSFNNILLLGPHPDDGEFGCGATAAKLIEQNCSLYYAMFSLCEESIPEGFAGDILKSEAVASAKILGIPEKNLIFFNFPVRRLPQYRQEILEEMVTLRKNLNPDLVILPSNQDLHQDHNTLAQEGWRAFKSASIIGYESIWNNLSFTTHMFSVIEPEHLEKKIQAIKSFKSQTFRSYSKESFIRSLAEVRGTQINRSLAEAFEVIRWIT
jgi:LmbE family N-acetylglucosaminyl deacetylase